MNKKNILIIVAVLIVAVIAVAVKVYKPQQAAAPGDGQTAAVEKPYTNTKGEKWGPLPEGPTVFQISSAEGVWPKFIEVKLDPPDVHVGDIQKMRVVVQSPSGIASVIADIETDNGTTTVPLKRTGLATFNDLMPIRYKVKDGTLNVLTEKQITEEQERTVAREKELIINKVRAEDGEKEVWESEWVVKDTHNTIYHTTFIATDNIGRVKSLTMAWSDLCGIPINGAATLSAACSIFTDQLEAVANGNFNLNRQALTIAGGTLGFMNGYEIKDLNLSGSSIAISGGGRIQQVSNVFVTDADGDLYAPVAYAKSFSPGGGTAAGSIVAATDCYDANANAKPGQTAYFVANRGDLSFDYDCNGIADKQYSESGQCETCSAPIACLANADGAVGFGGAVACGASGTYYTSPGSCSMGSNFCNTTCTFAARTQACR